MTAEPTVIIDLCPILFSLANHRRREIARVVRELSEANPNDPTIPALLHDYQIQTEIIRWLDR